ncbi:MAG: ABC transporter substrate-binding protein [Flavobacteriaceae bacterium]
MSCKQEKEPVKASKATNQIEFAKGFELYDYTDFKLLKIKNTSPESGKSQTYVLHKNTFQVPDSLADFTSIIIPVQHIIVTSTTHIPSLEMLEVAQTLIGFPGLDYISSETVRAKIEKGQVKEIGQNERINTEIVVDLDPDVLVSFAINESNQTLENLKQAGIKVLLNGDWNEKNPLGKAEWIKFFGALYDKEQKAQEVFKQIKSEYEKAKELASRAVTKPTIITGNIYEDVWYLPKGDSWSALFLADAHTEYFWKETSGTGSLALSFEEVFDTAQDADFWIGAGLYASLDEMIKANPHYKEFKAFKERNVYSFSSKKGATGGAIYYELAPNRPDLVLKDIIKITHPELLEDYELQFFERLK